MIRHNPKRDAALVSLIVGITIININCLVFTLIMREYFPQVAWWVHASAWLYMYVIGWVAPFGLRRKHANGK